MRKASQAWKRELAQHRMKVLEDQQARDWVRRVSDALLNNLHAAGWIGIKGGVVPLDDHCHKRPRVAGTLRWWHLDGHWYDALRV